MIFDFYFIHKKLIKYQAFFYLLTAIFIYVRSFTVKIEYLLLKENPTFDSMFGTFSGASGATTYIDPNGVVHHLNHQPDHLLNDIKHDHNSPILAENNGKMNKFSLIHGAIQNGVDETDSQLF
jgi:hypothetical protein